MGCSIPSQQALRGAEMNRKHLVLFDMNNRMFGPYLAASKRFRELKEHEVPKLVFTRDRTGGGAVIDFGERSCVGPRTPSPSWFVEGDIKIQVFFLCGAFLREWPVLLTTAGGCEDPGFLRGSEHIWREAAFAGLPRVLLRRVA
jgi:hypothetical protein